MDLSICIVTMNHSALIKECLTSIYTNPPTNYLYEIIVVDNCSIDGTLEYLKTVSSCIPQIRIIENKKPKNFAENNNIAIRSGSGLIKLILNPDTSVHTGTLDYMLSYLFNNHEVGAATCKLLYADGKFQENARRFITLKYMFFSRLHTWNIYTNNSIIDDYVMSKPFDVEPKEVDYILGACMFIKNEVFDTIGLFDERFLLYSEDTDLCYRIKKHGYSIMYVPDVSITHHYARTGANLFRKAAYIQLYTTFLFYAKHYWKIIK